jgi:hypothetical protein
MDIIYLTVEQCAVVILLFILQIVHLVLIQWFAPGVPLIMLQLL